MANMGLLGALSGLGTATTNLGESIIQRRERALAEARLLAAEQRKALQRQQERSEDKSFDLATLGIKEARADARTSATLQSRASEREEDREFRREERIAGQEFNASQKEADREAQKELTRLRASLSKETSAAVERLKEDLKADDVRAVQYGEPNAAGYAEVLIITQSGEVRPTGKRVYRPKKAEEEDDDTL